MMLHRELQGEGKCNTAQAAKVFEQDCRESCVAFLPLMRPEAHIQHTRAFKLCLHCPSMLHISNTSVTITLAFMLSRCGSAFVVISLHPSPANPANDQATAGCSH